MPDAKEEAAESEFSAAEEADAKKAKRKRAPAEEGEGEIEEDVRHVNVDRLSSEDMKLERIVAFPTWREMLLELVATKKLDPWNIDIVEIATGYLDKVRKLEMLDLRLPANLILAAAILLRFKSDALRLEEETQVVEEQTYVEEDTEAQVIPVLELKSRIPPKRMVTLDELLLAMEKVFDDQKKREEKAQKVVIPSVINIQLPEFNIEEKMEEVYNKVRSELDSEGLAMFSNVTSGKEPMEVILTLLPLLHLVQDGRLSIFQEQFFGEIFIRVREETKKESEKAG